MPTGVIANGTLVNGKNITYILPTQTNCIASIAVSSIFAVLFVIFLLALIVFVCYFGRKQNIKSNQKKLLALAGVLVFIQLLALIFRIAYFGESLKLRKELRNTTENPPNIIPLLVLGALEFSLILFQAITMVIIIGFIQTVL